MPRATHTYHYCLLPIFLIFVWIPAIIDYPTLDNLKIYAIIDALLNLLIFGFYWKPITNQRLIIDIYSYLKVINFVLGMSWFETKIGTCILNTRFQDVHNDLLLVQIMYLQLWILFIFYLLMFALYRQRIIDHYGNILEIWVLFRKYKKEGGRNLYKSWVVCQRSCTICGEEFGGDEDLYILDCGHAFHTDCIQRWEGYAIQTCPNCRAVVAVLD